MYGRETQQAEKTTREEPKRKGRNPTGKEILYEKQHKTEGGGEGPPKG